MKMSSPKIEVVRFANEDVIATSLFFMSAADYNAGMGTNFDTEYVWFNGSMSTANYDAAKASYEITDVHYLEGVSEDDLGFIRGMYFEEIGVYFPGHGGASYEAYVSDGRVYTKGVSYTESIGQ